MFETWKHQKQDGRNIEDAKHAASCNLLTIAVARATQAADQPQRIRSIEKMKMLTDASPQIAHYRYHDGGGQLQ
eukprot:9500173-Pyramimonas_sp.AAC.1